LTKQKNVHCKGARIIPSTHRSPRRSFDASNTGIIFKKQEHTIPPDFAKTPQSSKTKIHATPNRSNPKKNSKAMTVAATPTCTALNDKTTEIANTTALAEGPTKLNEPPATNTAIDTNEIPKDEAKAEEIPSVVNKSAPEESKAVEEAKATKVNAEETKTEATNTKEVKADEPKTEESNEATPEEPSVDEASTEAAPKDKSAADNIANAVIADTALELEESTKEVVSKKRKPEEDKLEDEESPSKKEKTETDTSK
jgi:hypothetical protein